LKYLILEAELFMFNIAFVECEDSYIAVTLVSSS